MKRCDICLFVLRLSNFRDTTTLLSAASRGGRENNKYERDRERIRKNAILLEKAAQSR